VDNLVELGLAEADAEADIDDGTEGAVDGAAAGVDETPSAIDSRAGFAGSVVVLVIAAVAGVALLAWLVLFWLAPPFLAWLGSHGV